MSRLADAGANADADAVTPSSNTRSYTHRLLEGHFLNNCLILDDDFIVALNQGSEEIILWELYRIMVQTTNASKNIILLC